MDDQDDAFGAELDDELEQNWYRLARRSQQVERKLLVRLLDRNDDFYEAFPQDRVAASRHSAYSTAGSPDEDEHDVRDGFGMIGQGRRFEMDRYEALVWALRAFRTRERVGQGSQPPIAHFCALWPADAAFSWDASRPTTPGAGYSEAMDDLRDELRWTEPGSIATFVVTHTYLAGLTAARLTPALWCITIPIPDHPVDPALIEELVRLGQWRGTEMARLDLQSGPAGSLQLLYRHSELNEIASLIMLGARLLRVGEPDEYLVDVMVDEHDLPWADEADPGIPAGSAQLAILRQSVSRWGEAVDEKSPAMVSWKKDFEHRAALRRDPSIDSRWHGFSDRFADTIASLEEDFGSGRWGTFAMTCHAAMHAFDGDASPQIRVTAHDGGWYCEIRDGTADEAGLRSPGLGIVPRGWGRGFAIAGDIHPDAHEDDTWEHGRLFAAGTSPFEVVHELLRVIILRHGVLSDDLFAVDGSPHGFAAGPTMRPLTGSWLFRLLDVVASPAPESIPAQVTTSTRSTESQHERVEPLVQVYEMQVDDSETAVFRCRAGSAEQAVAIALDAGFREAVLLAHHPIPAEEQTDRARAAAKDDPMLGPAWMPLIDAMAAELDRIEIHRPRTVQTYGRSFRFDPRRSPYFQFLRQADGTLLAEVHGPWSEGTIPVPSWEDRVRLLGWRLRGDEASVTSGPLLREEVDSPNPTKRFGAERSGYSIVSNVLSMVLFTWDITAEDLFALPGHPEVFDACPDLERIDGGKPIFRIVPSSQR